MNIDNLSYEDQFKYLGNLPFKDVMNYCQINTTAYDISQTKPFWQYKARETFNLNLDVVDSIRGPNRPVTSSAEKYRELEYLYNNEPEAMIRQLVEIEDLTDIPALLKEVVSEKSVLITDVLDIITAKDSVTLLEAVLCVFKVELDELINNGEIQDVIRQHYFDAILRNKMDIVKILERYYDPNEDNSEYLYEWLHQWQFEANSQKLKLLAAAGVSFDRLH